MIKQENCIIPINAPSLDDMLKDSIKKELYSWHSKAFVVYTAPGRIQKTVAANDVLKPEYLNFLGFKWRAMNVFFKKAGAMGGIHQDTHAEARQLPNAVDQPLAWAINWVYAGEGYYNFWDMNSITHVEGHNSTYRGFESDLPPYISFYTDISTPYLVSTYMPHQVHALTDRISFSLRADDKHSDMPWDEILTRLNTQK